MRKASWDKLCGLTYSAREMHKSIMKTCDHMSPCVKKASEKLFCHASGPENFVCVALYVGLVLVRGQTINHQV